MVCDALPLLLLAEQPVARSTATAPAARQRTATFEFRMVADPLKVR